MITQLSGLAMLVYVTKYCRHAGMPAIDVLSEDILLMLADEGQTRWSYGKNNWESGPVHLQVA